MPTNPIKVELYRRVLSYVQPFFSQNWSFFAPHPVSRDYILIAEGGAFDRRTGTTIFTVPVDISHPLFDQVAKNRFTLMLVIELMLSNAVLQYFQVIEQDPRAFEPIRGGRKLKAEITREIDVYDRTMLMRTAASILETSYPNAHFTRARLRILIHVYPHFNERWTGKDAVPDTSLVIGTDKFPQDVIPFPSARAVAET